MYPTVSYFLEDVFGISIPLPFPMYGAILAIAFIVGYFLLSNELKRRERLGFIYSFKKKVLVGAMPKPDEYFVSGFTGFLIGYKLIYGLLNYQSCVDNPQELVFSTDGYAWAGLLIAGVSVWYTWYSKNKTKLSTPKEEEETVHPYELTGNIVIICAIFAILGAKLFHILEYFDEFLEDPIGMIFNGGGLTFYGGMICSLIATTIYAWKNNIKPLQLLDSAGPAILICYGIGRLACHISGDGCWGIENLEPKPEWLSFLPDWMWAYDYPNNVIGEGNIIHNCSGKYCKVLEHPVFPTSIYESFISIFFGIILFITSRKVLLPGLIFSLCLLLNGIERFIIEKIRINIELDLAGGWTQAEVISTGWIVLGIAGIVFFIWKNKKDQISKA